MALFIRDGILYTTLHRQQAPSPLARKPHKMAEWKIDWWLGRGVRTSTGKGYVVAGGEFNAADEYILSLQGEDGSRVLRVPLVRANKAVRKGTWELV